MSYCKFYFEENRGMNGETYLYCNSEVEIYIKISKLQVKLFN